MKATSLYKSGKQFSERGESVANEKKLGEQPWKWNSAIIRCREVLLLWDVNYFVWLCIYIVVTYSPYNFHCYVHITVTYIRVRAYTHKANFNPKNASDYNVAT